MRRPHNTWAEVYDLAYEEEFGAFYEQFTQLTLKEIGKIVDPPSSIIDFGAGTGRLSLPLARRGYQITAVEPSAPMLQRLRGAAADVDIACIEARMQDFRSEQKFDLAVCVFTVITYLLDETDLRRAIMSAQNCLKPRGLLLLDVPSSQVFVSRNLQTDRIIRNVRIQPESGDLFNYSEEIVLIEAGCTDTLFADQFMIRVWPTDQVLGLARGCGFELVRDLSDRFASSGSNYYLLSKR